LKTVILSEAKNLALVFLGRSAWRRARFLASLGMTFQGFWAFVGWRTWATALRVCATPACAGATKFWLSSDWAGRRSIAARN